MFNWVCVLDDNRFDVSDEEEGIYHAYIYFLHLLRFCEDGDDFSGVSEALLINFHVQKEDPGV